MKYRSEAAKRYLEETRNRRAFVRAVARLGPLTQENSGEFMKLVKQYGIGSSAKDAAKSKKGGSPVVQGGLPSLGKRR